jgi:hypothetical protein
VSPVLVIAVVVVVPLVVAAGIALFLRFSTEKDSSSG